MKRVLIIGGYGNFGSFISRALAKQENISLVVAGRSLAKAQALAAEIDAEAVEIDIHSNLEMRLSEVNPAIVIHTSGPFQSQGYDVAEACIKCGAHYIDLADGREFVSGISRLDLRAKQAGTLVVSGASSVPCLTSALIDHYRGEFEVLEHLDYGISTAQKTTRGVATTAAILSYTGKSFKTLVDGEEQDIYGWQGLCARKYSGLGWRLLGNCNVPDLALFPKIYPELKTVRFYAGLELPFIHITLWALSWLVRIGLVRSLEPVAPLLLKLSFLFDWLGSANSGFHMALTGKGKGRGGKGGYGDKDKDKGEKYKDSKSKTIRFELIARNGDGPFIPCMPAIILAKKLASDDIKDTGATPCVGIITKTEYLEALEALDIRWTESLL